MSMFKHPLENFEKRPVITEEQFLQGFDDIGFRELMYRTYQVPLELFYKYQDQLKEEIFWICSYQELTEEDMNSKEFIDATERVDSYHCWVSISAFQKLSEEFIERHYNDVAWEHICYTQELSEEFIRRFVRKFQQMIISIVAALKWSGKWSEELQKEFLKAKKR